LTNRRHGRNIELSSPYQEIGIITKPIEIVQFELSLFETEIEEGEVA
jgi:hypothetical protein